MKIYHQLREMEQITYQLASSKEKVWMVTKAVLKNIHGTFDISNDVALKDDEFVFRRMPSAQEQLGAVKVTLDYRPGHSINIHGATLQEIAEGEYGAVQRTMVSVVDAQHGEVTAFDGELLLTVLEEEKLIARWNFEPNVELQLELRTKTDMDYFRVPQCHLEFKQAFTLESSGVEGYAPDILGSRSENCLYFATKEDWGNAGKQKYGLDGVLLERVSRIDLDTGTINDIYAPGNFYATKRLLMTGKELLVVGACNINSYDVKLDVAPSILMDYATYLNPSFRGFSRFGAAYCGGRIYVVGGAMHSGGVQMGKDCIHVYDCQKDTFEVFADLSEPLAGAGVEVVHHRLYVFGGSDHFRAGSAHSTLRIFDLSTGKERKEKLPVALPFVHTCRREHLIFVAGHTEPGSKNAHGNGTALFFGVYDTRNGNLTRLNTNLPMDTGESIHAMTMVGDDIYILFGKKTVDDYQLQDWSILKAPFL